MLKNSTSPDLRDFRGRLLKVHHKVQHVVDNDLGTVIAIEPATSRVPAHLVVEWAGEAGPHAHFGDELIRVTS